MSELDDIERLRETIRKLNARVIELNQIVTTLAVAYYVAHRTPTPEEMTQAVIEKMKRG